MAFEATHVAPAGGLATWDQPDVARPIGPAIPSRLPVHVVESWGDWALVECDNGWRAWVDGRLLDARGGLPVPAAPAPTASGTPAPATLDQTPLRVGPVPISTSLVGAALALLGAFFPWISADGVTSGAMDVPVKFLFDYKVATNGGLKIGILVLALAAVAFVLSAWPTSRQARRSMGLLLVVTATLFTAQLQRLLSQTPGATQSASLFKTVGFGVYLTLVGGILIGVGKVPGEQAKK